MPAISEMPSTKARIASVLKVARPPPEEFAVFGMTLSERLRALTQNPAKMVRRIGVSEGQKVADIGAGKGYLTLPAATAVGAGGFVYAVEPDSARSNKIRERVTKAGLKNVQVLTTGVERLGEIPSDSLDLAFSVFSIHHFVDRKTALTELRRVLHSGGIFYVWDRAPGTLMRHGTRPEELHTMKEGFTAFDVLDAGRTVRARFTK